MKKEMKMNSLGETMSKKWPDWTVLKDMPWEQARNIVFNCGKDPISSICMIEEWAAANAVTASPSDGIGAARKMFESIVGCNPMLWQEETQSYNGELTADAWAYFRDGFIAARHFLANH